MKAQNPRTREVFPQPLIFGKTVWEPLVNHVVVVIAQPQVHSYESRPVLHAAKGREVLLFVINACEKALITAGAFAGQVRVEWKRPLLASSGTRSHSTPLLWAQVTRSLWGAQCQTHPRPTELTCIQQSTQVTPVHVRWESFVLRVRIFKPHFQRWSL